MHRPVRADPIPAGLRSPLWSRTGGRRGPTPRPPAQSLRRDRRRQPGMTKGSSLPGSPPGCRPDADRRRHPAAETAERVPVLLVRREWVAVVDRHLNSSTRRYDIGLPPATAGAFGEGVPQGKRRSRCLTSPKATKEPDLTNRCQSAMYTARRQTRPTDRCGVDHGRGRACDQVAVSEPLPWTGCARSGGPMGRGAVSMGWLEALVLGIVQGLTEFLPISSSAHQSIVGQAFGGRDPGSAFTAITQLGTESAVIIFFPQGHLADHQELDACADRQATAQRPRGQTGLAGDHWLDPDRGARTGIPGCD